jgi:hypothetical protein
MTLGQGRGRIDLLWFGYGNTRGDLISWVKALDSIMALKPRVVVPGHGR